MRQTLGILLCLSAAGQVAAQFDDVKKQADTGIAKKQADGTKKQADGTKKQADAMKKQALEAIKKQAALKKQAEFVRKQADTLKKQAAFKKALELKKQADGAKKQADFIKKQADNAKKQAAFKKALELKKQADGAKKQSDNAKKQAEFLRKQVEMKKQADGAKKQAEYLRKQAELTKKQAAGSKKQAAGSKKQASKKQAGNLKKRNMKKSSGLKKRFYKKQAPKNQGDGWNTVKNSLDDILDDMTGGNQGDYGDAFVTESEGFEKAGALSRGGIRGEDEMSEADDMVITRVDDDQAIWMADHMQYDYPDDGYGDDGLSLERWKVAEKKEKRNDLREKWWMDATKIFKNIEDDKPRMWLVNYFKYGDAGKDIYDVSLMNKDPLKMSSTELDRRHTVAKVVQLHAISTYLSKRYTPFTHGDEFLQYYLKLQGYGCHCSPYQFENNERTFTPEIFKGTKGQALDDLDKSCHSRNSCYRCIQMEHRRCDYRMSYNMTFTDINNIECQDALGTCERALCDCDKKWFENRAAFEDNYNNGLSHDQGFSLDFGTCDAQYHDITYNWNHCCGGGERRQPYSKEAGQYCCNNRSLYRPGDGMQCCENGHVLKRGQYSCSDGSIPRSYPEGEF